MRRLKQIIMDSLQRDLGTLAAWAERKRELERFKATNSFVYDVTVLRLHLINLSIDLKLHLLGMSRKDLE